MDSEEFYKLYESSEPFRLSLGSWSAKKSDLKNFQKIYFGKQLQILAKDQRSDFALVSIGAPTEFAIYDLWENKSSLKGDLSYLLCGIQRDELVDLIYLEESFPSEAEEVTITNSLKAYGVSDNLLKNSYLDLDKLSEIISSNNLYDVCAILATSKIRTAFILKLEEIGRLSQNESDHLVHSIILENFRHPS